MTHETKSIRVLVGADGTLTVTETESVRHGPETPHTGEVVFAMALTLPEERSDAMRGMTATAIDAVAHRLRDICGAPSGYPQPDTVVLVRGGAAAVAAVAEGGAVAFAASSPTAAGCFVRAADGRLVLEVLTDLGPSEVTIPDAVMLQEVPGYVGCRGLARYLAEHEELSAAMFQNVLPQIAPRFHDAFAREIETIAVRTGKAKLADATWETIGDPTLVDACIRATEWASEYVLQVALQRCVNGALLAERLAEPIGDYEGRVPRELRSLFLGRLLCLGERQRVSEFLCTVSEPWLAKAQDQTGARDTFYSKNRYALRNESELLATVVLDPRTDPSVRREVACQLSDVAIMSRVIRQYEDVLGERTLGWLRERLAAATDRTNDTTT